MPARQPGLLTEAEAVYYTGRPAATIRRWAHEGRINRYGSGRGNVRYHFRELPWAKRDEYSREVIELGETPKLPEGTRAA